MVVFLCFGVYMLIRYALPASCATVYSWIKTIKRSRTACHCCTGVATLLASAALLICTGYLFLIVFGIPQCLTHTCLH